MKIEYFTCQGCHGIVRFDGGLCENCGADDGYRQPINLNEARVFNNLTGREKDAIKAFIVNSLTEFRSKNMTLIQQNWQLQRPIAVEFWNSIAQSIF